MKNLIKYFIGIPVIVYLLFGIINFVCDYGFIYLETLSQTIYEVTETIFKLIMNVFEILLICKLIFYYSKITITFETSGKNGIEYLKKNFFWFLIIIVLALILIFYSSMESVFLSKHFSYKETKINYFVFLVKILITAFFEELIFRKILFDYCEKNGINHEFFWSVLCFSISHIISLPSTIFLGLILSFSYKKFKSFFLNVLISCLCNVSILFLTNKFLGVL